MDKFQYGSFFQQKIELLKKEKRYRTFQLLERREGSFPIVQIEGALVTVWCSNDYMCLSQHPDVIKSCQEGAKRGVGSGGTRNISGTSAEIVELEERLASLHKTDSALVGTSGYVMNQATIGTIGRILPNCLVLSDQLNHSSIIHGIKNAGCEKAIFKHNDVDDLARLLKEQDIGRPKLIVCESIYSMEGDTCPIEDVYLLAQDYGAIMYVDEVHAVGLYGDSGGGICQEKGVKPDIIEGNFGKGFGTFGGYIASNRLICDLVRSEAPEFIFTTSMPIPILTATLASISVCYQFSMERDELQRKSELIRDGLEECGIEINSGLRHIIPVWIGDPALCNKFCKTLLEKENIYLQPINYPSVEKGKELVRITVTRLHTDEMIRSFIQKFARTWHKIMKNKS